MAASVQRLPLTSRQLAIIITSGILLWFVGALVCRWVGDAGWYDGARRWLVYLALIPGTLPALLLVRRIARLGDDAMALAASIATAAAITCDSVALVVIPDLYAANSADLASSGAVILWGAAVAIGLGCWLNRAPG